MSQPSTIPQPGQLLEDAEQVSVKFNVEDYWQVILVLRQKNYSWRDIAAWFNQKGLPCEHTRIYRFGRKCAALQIATLPEEERAFAVVEMLSEAIHDLIIHGNLPELIREIQLSEAGVDEYAVPGVEVNPDEGLVFSIHFTVTSAHADAQNDREPRIRGTATGILRPDNSVEYSNIAAEEVKPVEPEKPAVLRRGLFGGG